jgi:hypothetical protein
MASYTVSQRVTAPSPHLRAGSTPYADGDAMAPTDAARLEEIAQTGFSVTRLELLRDEDDGFEAWLERMRIAWDQTTWYLFNAEGWR